MDLEIYNIMGQKIRTLVSGTLDAGRHTVRWDGTDDRGKKVSSGIYLYRVSKEGSVAKEKMMFLK
ncbi:MAG: FlgD immunoglobulin-like domain containing protein [Candidatus Latescibacterota bacterium]